MMTAPAKRLRGFGRPLSWVRWGTATSAAAIVALLSLPGGAWAQDPGFDQVTGVGPTASAVTVPWTQGLRDASNNPIASAGTELSPNSDRSSQNPTSKLSFMYNDFKDLKVTVSQTQDLTQQGITVSWTGGKPTVLSNGVAGANFLQMMECYGDAASGPTPEQCEYGSSGMLPPGAPNAVIATRTGTLCADPNAVPSTDPSKTPKDQNGSVATGCDTQETDPAAIPPKCPLTWCSGGSLDVPFVPVSDTTTSDYSIGDITYYSSANTDEVQQAVTASDGSGKLQFETLTGVQASGLGCGLPDPGDNNKPRGCWLVIVPRGQYEPNGWLYSGSPQINALNTSPLSASNWAQRIQIHLSFASAPQFCPIGTQERQTDGTQLIQRAMQSWVLALNRGTNCAKVYTFTPVPEPTSTSQLADPTSGMGLAFTTIPIGSEATRSGGSPPPNLPPVLYAPVAVSALGFGFNINMASGYYATAVHLSPVLLAKALTQSYRMDLPDFVDPAIPAQAGPAWSHGNPLNISQDPQFTALNPNAPTDQQYPTNPLLVEEHSALTQQVWQWIQGDSAASSWLDGNGDTSDKNDNVAVNPAYQSLNLGAAPATDSYPRAYDGGSEPGKCADLGQGATDVPGKTKDETKCALDLLPYTSSFDSAAAAVLAANNPDDSRQWNSTLQAPDGTDGWWQATGTEPIGQIWMWAATDTSNLAAYGLIAADLCDDGGGKCVSPTTSSLTAALNAAKPDSSGLLHVDAANPGNGGYPLTVVTYAAVSTKQSAAALKDYANLIAYAAGQGQAIGSAPGDLPPGYLPMPSSLKAKAQDVVTKLRNIANGSAGGSPAPTATSGTTPGGAGTQPGATPTSSPGSSHSAAPTASTTTPPGGAVTSLPQAQPAAATTPRQVVGALRWALVSVAITGGGAAGGGTLLRSGGIPLWLRRRKPG